MKILTALFTLLLAGYGFWWVGANHPELKNKVVSFVNVGGSFHTLEVRYNANQIMESHRRELLKSNRHKYLDPQLSFYPYLLLEVKYLIGNKTHEGMMLWDLTDGEMVIDTKDWEKTHGFGDCINTGADRQEFKILNLLAKKGGSLDHESLAKGLHIDNDILDAWLESCRRKKLIVQAGNRYRLHFENPILKTLPETHIAERLVTKPCRNAARVTRNFSLTQIERLAKAAFGNDFTIRRTSDVYLPVHNIVVQNPDGSIHTSHWNALNGKKLSQSAFIE